MIRRAAAAVSGLHAAVSTLALLSALFQPPTDPVRIAVAGLWNLAAVAATGVLSGPSRPGASGRS